MQTVHHNHLKLCTSPKSNKRSNTSDSVNELEQNEPQQVIANQKEDDLLIGIIPNTDSESHRGRPARNRHPPNRYGNAILDYDSLIP